MITNKEFNTTIWDKTKTYPDDWRLGQKVFNAAEELLWNMTNQEHNIAREVQFIDGIDCFYNDDKIIEFLLNCWLRFNDWQK